MMPKSLLMDFAIGLELQTTHLHRGDNFTAAATNSAPALTLGCASCFFFYFMWC
jgi:hypothetical protein